MPEAAELTEAGREAAHMPRPATMKELQERIFVLLGKGEQKLLTLLIAAYPESLTRAELSEKARYKNMKLGGFAELLARLLELGFAEAAGPGVVRGGDMLILKGKSKTSRDIGRAATLRFVTRLLTLVAKSRGEGWRAGYTENSADAIRGWSGHNAAMSLKQQHEFSIPEQTRRVARAAFPKGCTCLSVADVLGCVYQDRQFAALFPRRGQPAEAPGRLALATVLQFMEGLPDRQAADAVRARIDWKYALGLELTDAGFDRTVLSEFRSRLIGGGLELLLLDALLEQARTLGLLKQRGRQRTDSTHVLAAVRSMNRLERVGETLRAALNALADAAPEWLRVVAEPDWFTRYGNRVENFSLPKTEAGRKQLAAVIGLDGRKLLHAVGQADARLGLAALPAVQLLERI